MGRSMDGPGNVKTPAIFAFGLAFVGMVGAELLTGLGHVVPTELWQATFAALGAGAGISIPGSP